MMKLKLIAVLTLAFCLLLPYANGASASVHDEGTGQRPARNRANWWLPALASSSRAAIVSPTRAFRCPPP